MAKRKQISAGGDPVANRTTHRNGQTELPSSLTFARRRHRTWPLNRWRSCQHRTGGGKDGHR